MQESAKSVKSVNANFYIDYYCRQERRLNQVADALHLPDQSFVGSCMICFSSVHFEIIVPLWG